MFDEDESVFQAMRAGARGYLLKGADREDDAARGARGRPAATRSSARRWPAGSSATSPRRRAGAAPFADLTEREREVLELVARGRSNAEIGKQLMISAKTVRNHVSNVFAKLQVSDRAQAIIRAREAGLGS